MTDLNNLVWSEISLSSMPEILPVDSLEDYAERLQDWAARQPQVFKYVGKTYKNAIAPPKYQGKTYKNALAPPKYQGKTYKNLITSDLPPADHPFASHLQKLFKPDDWICVMWIHSPAETVWREPLCFRHLQVFLGARTSRYERSFTIWTGEQKNVSVVFSVWHSRPFLRI